MATRVLFVVRDLGVAYDFRSMLEHVHGTSQIHVAAEHEGDSRRKNLFEDAALSFRRVSYGKALNPDARLWPPVQRAVWPGAVDAFLDRHQPDVLLLASWDTGRPQMDYARAAKARGIRTVWCVNAWDQLRAGGPLREQPDCTAVWNRLQRREAADVLGIPPQNTVVVGAPGYDSCFDAKPSGPGADARALLGIPSTAPLFLLACGRNADPEHERAFIGQWMKGLRAHPDPRLRDAGVLIRPNPEGAGRAPLLKLSEYGNVLVLDHQQVSGAGPEGSAAHAGALESCDAVIGTDTALLFESGIAGKPFFGWVPADSSARLTDQPDALGSFSRAHAEIAKDWLFLSSSLDDHYVRLADRNIAGRGLDPGTRIVIRNFVRPHGPDISAGQLLMQVLDEVASYPNPAAAPSRASAVRAGVSPLVRAAMHFSLAPEGIGARAPRRRRVLVLTTSTAFSEKYSMIPAALTERGCIVTVSVAGIKGDRAAVLRELRSARPDISYTGGPRRREDAWEETVDGLGRLVEFTRYLQPAYRGGETRHAMGRKMLPGSQVFTRWAPTLGKRTHRVFLKCLERFRHAVPSSPIVRSWLERDEVDALLVLPATDGATALDTAAAQVEAIRAAKACGISTAAVIGNADTVTNAALIQARPDVVFAGDAAERDEALGLFGATRAHVTMTGSADAAAVVVAERVASLLKAPHPKPSRTGILDLAFRPLLFGFVTGQAAGERISRSAPVEQLRRKIRQVDRRKQKRSPKTSRKAGKSTARWGKKLLHVARAARYRAATLFRS